MPDFLNGPQSALVISLIVIPSVAAFLTARVEKIRTILETAFKPLAYLDGLIKKMTDARELVILVKGHIEKMLEDGKIDEQEVRQLYEEVSKLYAALSLD